MVDTVDTITTADGQRNHVVRLTCVSDGTGESDVVKVDASTLTGPDGKVGLAPDSFAIEYASWVIQGFSSVRVEFDATTDSEGMVLTGVGERFFDPPLQDPKASGYTGDILLTSAGAVNGATYDIVLHLIKKQ
jgi:hypothetical protein